MSLVERVLFSILWKDGMGQGEKGRFESVRFLQTRDCWERGIKLLPSSDPWDFHSLSLPREERAILPQEARLVQCTSPEFSRASCLAAHRPQVSFNCVSNWLLPMQLLPCHTQYFTAPGRGQEGLSFWRTTFILSHLWAPNVDREEAHVKLKSGTGHQWWLVLIDCSVIPLCDRDSETIRANEHSVVCHGNSRDTFL